MFKPVTAPLPQEVEKSFSYESSEKQMNTGLPSFSIIIKLLKFENETTRG